MRAAPYAFALSVVLALTSPPARFQNDQAYTKNEAKPLCKDSPSKLLVYGLGMNNILYDSRMNKGLNKVSIEYGSHMRIRCMGTNPKNLAIFRNDMKLVTGESPYYINWFTGKLDLKPSEYVLTCIDFKTTCELSAIILVTPRFEVQSPNIGNCLRSKRYIAHYGYSVSVLCSGAEAARLIMTKDGKTLPTKPKNATTIESFERTPDLQISEYFCTDVDTSYNGSVIVRVVPKIYFQSRNKMITPYQKYLTCYGTLVQHYSFEYSGSIEVFCSGPRAVKFIGEEHVGLNLLTEKFNKNTVFTSIRKLGKSEYTCSDNEFSDYAQRVMVVVVPRMEVTSPSARFVGTEGHFRCFTIPYGHPLEIVCFGPDSSRLTIRDSLGDIITNSVEQTVNKSAVKYTVQESVWHGFKKFVCKGHEKGYGFPTYVEVGVLPEAIDFRCVAYNRQFVNCTWKTINRQIFYTLSHALNGILHPVCTQPRRSPQRYYNKLLFCVWDYMTIYSDGFSDTPVRDLTFIMQSRNKIGSTNQTFHFDHLTILKPAPPKVLKVINKTTRGAVLEWRCGYIEPGFHCQNYQYKVQYWHPGIGSQDGNSSLVTCQAWICKIELNLRCPGEFYQIWISQKLKKAIGEEFWSEPSYVSLKTDNENDNTNNTDPKCNPEPVKTKDVMQYFVRELRKEIRLEMQPMKQKIRLLHDKLAYIPQKSRTNNNI